MPREPVPLNIPGEVLAEVFEHARGAFPDECCGWLAGPREGKTATSVRRCLNAQRTGAHSAAPERGADRAYVIDGVDLIALNQSFDGDEPALVLYHSHPSGRVCFSQTDRRVATSPWGNGPAYPLQQLVVGIEDGEVVGAALFAWSKAAGDFVEIARYAAAVAARL